MSVTASISIHDRTGRSIGEYRHYPDRIEVWINDAADFNVVPNLLAENTGTSWRLVYKLPLGKHVTARFEAESPAKLKAAS